jgi:hypothetical protein
VRHEIVKPHLVSFLQSSFDQSRSGTYLEGRLLGVLDVNDVQTAVASLGANRVGVSSLLVNGNVVAG